MASRSRVRIGITLGDINGIGTEVALKAVSSETAPGDVEFVLVGDATIVRDQACAMGLPKADAFAMVWGPAAPPRLRWTPGRVQPAAAAYAASCITAAVAACERGDLDAIVTAPISKEGFARAGIDVPGHTEMLAELTRTKRFAMMLFGGPLRVVLATRHIPISAVPKAVTRSCINEAVTLTSEALPWLGCPKRRIAVCGLNPHAGDGGAIGTEDDRIIRPAVAALRRKGIRASGPHPGDTVFHAAAQGAYDAVVAMYHDQGLAPLKLIAFDRGVNVTLGLPIVRTSPDHGTAYDIAGKGKANPASMLEAIHQAAFLARRRNPWA